jgi:hypothetical protein
MQCLAWEQLRGIAIAAVSTAFLQPLSNMTPLEQVKCFSQSFWIRLIQLNRDLSHCQLLRGRSLLGSSCK